LSIIKIGVDVLAKKFRPFGEVLLANCFLGFFY